MILFAIALLFAISAFLSIREDEEWLGHFVFPRNHEVSVFNKGGEVFQKWSLIPAKVIEEMPDSLTIKTDRYPGPYVGDVKKADAVTMADAPKYFTSLIIKNSNNYLAWLYRAEVWLMNNDFDKSIQDFTEAIRLNHSNYTYTCRGIAWLEKQDYNKAIIDFDMAILLDPSIPESLINRGVAWLAKQEHNKAIKDFDDTLRLKPSFIDAFLQRGYARHHIHEYDKAIADYSETLLLDSKNVSAICARGNAWHSKKEYDKAIEDFTEAIRIDHDNVSAFCNRGYAWHSKGEYDKAIQDYHDAIQLCPDYCYSLNNLAWLLATCQVAKFRNGKRAVELATKACELSKWKIALFIGTLGAAHAELGDFEKAIEYQKAALKDKAYDQRYGEEARGQLKHYEQKMPFYELAPTNCFPFVLSEEPLVTPSDK